MYLLDSLDGEVQKKPSHSAKSSIFSYFQPTSMETKAADYLAKCRQNSDSIITDLFYGLQYTAIECQFCQDESLSFEEFNHLCLDINNPSLMKYLRLEDLLSQYLNTEQIHDLYTCSKCKRQFRNFNK